ncbi:hypothetical protein L9F63_017694, partial [Diploptera punctata]
FVVRPTKLLEPIVLPVMHKGTGLEIFMSISLLIFHTTFLRCCIRYYLRDASSYG